MGWPAHPFNPDLDPAKTPRARKGPRAKCECDNPECRICRRAACQRRFYHRNVEARRESQRKRVRAMRAGEHVENTRWDDLDRKAFEMLRQEGLR